jgi:16S rRNA processing protein RimM
VAADSQPSAPTSRSSPPALLEIGRIDRPHGVKGDVLVTLTTNRDDRLVVDAEFVTDDGVVRVVTVRPHQHRFIVGFEGFDRERAEATRGTVLRAEAIDDPEVLWVHELIGAEVRDVDGRSHGTVESVEANPASDLLVLAGGALVPLRFVVETTDDGVLVIDPPAGLLDD